MQRSERKKHNPMRMYHERKSFPGFCWEYTFL
jgi:hypothetical protein